MKTQQENDDDGDDDEIEWVATALLFVTLSYRMQTLLCYSRRTTAFVQKHSNTLQKNNNISAHPKPNAHEFCNSF